MFRHRHQILKCLITQCCHQLTVLSALSLQIAPKIYSLRKRPKIPKWEDVSIEKSSAHKSKKVKVEPEIPQSVVTDPDSEDVSVVKLSAHKSKKVKVEPEIPQSVVTVTSSSVMSKKCKLAVVTNENQGITPKVAKVDENAAIVVGQSKGRNGTKNIRQIKQTRKSVLCPMQITGSDDEELDADEADFRKRQAAAVAKLKLQQEQQKQTQKEQLEVMIKQEQQKQKAANRKSAKCSKSQLQKQKQQSRSEWFDPEKYDTKQIRHPPPVKKVLPAGAEIYCGKCNEVFNDVSS